MKTAFLVAIFAFIGMHERVVVGGKMVDAEPVGCFKHPDVEHQEIAESCGYCDDFHCFNVK